MKTLRAAWQSPSNIALVKYWGKKAEGVQLPANPSISMTLQNCHTQTVLEISEGEGIDVVLEGKPKPAFVDKIIQFRERLPVMWEFVQRGHWNIQTSNSFPHSSGIASSASAFSALALCLCDIAVQKGVLDQKDLEHTASELARLGSGSACRSIYGGMVTWGEHEALPHSSDTYATQWTAVHPNFQDYRDTVLLIHKGAKSVSSTVGHSLLNDHPYAQARFEQANKHLLELMDILQNGDRDGFVQLVESEALSLHAMMLSSEPSFILLQEGTVAVIRAIKEARERYKRPWCFTLDAGANVHFLYPAEDEPLAMEFVDKELSVHCDNGSYICDQMGQGPIRQ